MKNIKSRGKMSLLEKLPTELLEIVYLYTMSLDLPRSSPVIASKLSRKSIYIQTVLRAFDPTWTQAPHRLDPYIPTEEKIWDRTYPYAEIQSAILRCRWASLPILLEAKDVWLEKYCRARTFKDLCESFSHVRFSAS